MGTKTRKYIFFTLFIMICLFVSVFILRKDKSVEDALLYDGVVESNEPLPKIELFDRFDGASVSVFSGKVLVIYVLDGCDACSLEGNIINEIASNRLTSVKFVMVNSEINQNTNQVVKNNSQYHNKFVSAIDKNNELSKHFKIHAFPFNMLIQDGVVIKKWAGIKDKEQLLRYLNE